MSQELYPLVAQALQTLSKMLGRKPAGIVGVTPLEQGWKMYLEVVEKESIPSSQDVLGQYEVILDATGNVLQFQRTKMRRRGEAASA